MKKEKVLKRIKEQLEIMTRTLKFNEVHIEAYVNSRGKTRYKGKIRVHDVNFSFTDLKLYDIDNIFDAIITGYAFALEQIDHDIKK